MFRDRHLIDQTSKKCEEEIARNARPVVLLWEADGVIIQGHVLCFRSGCQCCLLTQLAAPECSHVIIKLGVCST